MKTSKKIWCRIYQGAFKLALPLLPYRSPKVYHQVLDVLTILKDNQKQKPLLVCDKQIRNLGLTKELEQAITDHQIALTVYDGVVPNPTTKEVGEAEQMYKDNNCDCLIAFGGGSSLDCAKAVGARIAKPKQSLAQMKGVLKILKPIPLLIALPTTAGTGSETTLAAVITDEKTRYKYAINDFPLIPKYAILDASLTHNLPAKLQATTGLDALTHAIEAYIGRSLTKDTTRDAIEAIKLIFANLEKACLEKDLPSQSKMLEASFLAGKAFTKSYVGYVHAVAHSIGGKYNTAHGLANAVLLPIVLQEYGTVIDDKLAHLAYECNFCSTEEETHQASIIFMQHLRQLETNLNIPTSLPEIQSEDIKEMAIKADKEGNPLYPVPVLWDNKELEHIYVIAQKGITWNN